MNVNFLLSEDQYYKYLIIYCIELKKNQYCTTSKLTETISISRYKIEKLIQEINQDLLLINTSAKIDILPTTEIDSNSISYITVKKLRIQYLEDSSLFKLLHNYLVTELSLNQQVSELHMSRSSAYNQYRELKRVLQDNNLSIKKNQIIGDEFHLRKCVFSLYYEAFNGLCNPFPIHIQRKSEEILKQLISGKENNLSETKRIKLIIFICTWLIRIQTKHFVNSSLITIKESQFQEYLESELLKVWKVPINNLRHEIAYLFLFLYLEDIDKSMVERFIRTEEEITAEEISQQFLIYMNRNCQINSHEWNFLLKELKDINRKWLIYHLKETTFVTERNSQYFQEINPKLDSLVITFLNRLDQQSLFHCEDEKNKLYYDYLFLLVTRISITKIESPLLICIDFSHGDNYNQYIHLMLSSLQSMNIEYETKVNNLTDLYISDCLIGNLSCPQLIWKNPPTQNDWRELGEMLVKLKGEKNEE